MKIIVTGGAGFVGSHLCETLAIQGHEVLCIDNYFTGCVSNHIDNALITYVSSDSIHIEAIAESNYFKPDIVYHLGEYSRVEQSFKDIDLVFEYNKAPIKVIADYCRRVDAKMIYAGSSTKFTADDSDDYTQSPYAWSKESNTVFLNTYAKWYPDFKYAITYFYNVYGEREINTGEYATLIGLFLKKKAEGFPLTVVKPGYQLRNFTYVKDIINGLILVGDKGVGDGYEIGHNQAYQIINVANMFECEIEWLEERRGNRYYAAINTSKVELLGWEPQTNLFDYVKGNL